MTDTTSNKSIPQLADIPKHSEMNIPTLSSTNNANGNTSIQNTKDAMYNNTQSAFNSVANHPATQNIKDNITQGWLVAVLVKRAVAESVKDQHAKTTNEFSNLASARTTPNATAATGQNLTHYHSFFYNLLSWENPRATALTFTATVLFIFAARYLPALRWSFKVLYMTLGVAAAAEVAGKLVLSRGLTSSFRPRKYYTIPKETLEASLEDVEQLINFFVIEFQRILFAENVIVTIAAFASSVIAYWLIKFLPLWGLSLIATSIIYLAPLIYISNKELIDHHLNNASDVVNTQANQVKDLAGHHTARLTETVKAQTSTYSAKAQEYMGAAKAQTSAAVSQTSAAVSGNKSTSNNPFTSEPGAAPKYSSSDFPHAPKQEPVPGVESHQQQYEKSEFGGQAVAQ